MTTLRKATIYLIAALMALLIMMGAVSARVNADEGVSEDAIAYFEDEDGDKTILSSEENLCSFFDSDTPRIGTLYLLSDIDLDNYSLYIRENSDVTIVAGDYHITGEDSLLSIVSEGNLTFDGGIWECQISLSGSSDINNGIFSFNVFVTGNGNINMNGGSINYIQILNNGSATVSNGTIDQFYVSNNGIATITNGKIEYLVIEDSGSATVTGGEIFESHSMATIEAECSYVKNNGYTVYIPEHEVVVDRAVAATLTSTGLTQGSHCSVCGTVITAQRVVPQLTPTPTPSPKPTVTPVPTVVPTVVPTTNPTVVPTQAPDVEPSTAPTAVPTVVPSTTPTTVPTAVPTSEPTVVPTSTPSPEPTAAPTVAPTEEPTIAPTVEPTVEPTPEVEILTGVVGFCERLYTCALGRESDVAGRDWWADALRHGATGAFAAEGFFFSEEIVNSGISDEEFVHRLYLTFMDREPAAAEMDYWMNEMDNNGMTRELAFGGFIHSTEWANVCVTYGILSGGMGVATIEVEASEEVIAFATRLYTTCLGREADQAGLEWWSAELANLRTTGSAAAQAYFFSNEFINSNVDDEEFVDRLYLTFMDRNAGDFEFEYWLGEMGNGMTRETVFSGFAGSEEFGNICAEYGIIR